MPPAMFGLSAEALSSRYLSFADREEIALLRAQGFSQCRRSLSGSGGQCRRSPESCGATPPLEAVALEYRATTAHWHPTTARRPKQAKLALNAALRTYVEERLAGVVVAQAGLLFADPGRVLERPPTWTAEGPAVGDAWSPEQIARRLPIDFPDDETMRISHEAIYQALFVQGRGALRRELTACLRTGRALRMPRARTRRRARPSSLPRS